MLLSLIVSLLDPMCKETSLKYALECFEKNVAMCSSSEIAKHFSSNKLVYIKTDVMSYTLLRVVASTKYFMSV